MKESLFEILLNLFEKISIQLKEKHQQADANKLSNDTTQVVSNNVAENKSGLQLHFVKAAQTTSTRVFTQEEQIKLTKSSLQFLVQMLECGVLHSALFELIINRLLISDSRIVSLQETKWTIRNTLSETFNTEQMAFLELILYHKEDGMLLH